MSTPLNLGVQLLSFWHPVSGSTKSQSQVEQNLKPGQFCWTWNDHRHHLPHRQTSSVMQRNRFGMPTPKNCVQDSSSLLPNSVSLYLAEVHTVARCGGQLPLTFPTYRLRAYCDCLPNDRRNPCSALLSSKMILESAT